MTLPSEPRTRSNLNTSDRRTAWRRRLRRFARNVFFAVVALVVLWIAVPAVALRPPEPLAVPQRGLVLSGVTIVNPGLDRREHQTITVSGGQIVSIGDTPSADPKASHAEFAGSFVLPGLIDMHVHNPPPSSADFGYFMLMYLAYGVTTIRDPGNDGQILAVRREVVDGHIAGPRVFTCGQVLDGDPPIWPSAIVVHNTVEAERAVDTLAAQAPDCIKVYQHLTPDALAGAVRAAHRHGLPVVGHVPAGVAFEDAHLDDVQHLVGVPYMAHRIYPTPEEWLLATAEAWRAVDEGRIAFVVKTSLEQHLVHTPTLVQLYRSPALVGFDSQLRDPIVKLVPSWYPEVFWRQFSAALALPAVRDPRQTADPYSIRKLIVRRLHEAGVTLHVGTDALMPFVVPGESLHEEMRNFVDAGFSVEEVWSAVTRGNGSGLPLGDLGVLRVGAPGDFLVFREDPSHDLSKLASLEGVVADGRLYTHEQLDQALIHYRTRFNSAGYGS